MTTWSTDPPWPLLSSSSSNNNNNDTTTTLDDDDDYDDILTVMDLVTATSKTTTGVPSSCSHHYHHNTVVSAAAAAAASTTISMFHQNHHQNQNADANDITTTTALSSDDPPPVHHNMMLSRPDSTTSLTYSISPPSSISGEIVVVVVAAAATPSPTPVSPLVITTDFVRFPTTTTTTTTTTTVTSSSRHDEPPHPLDDSFCHAHPKRHLTTPGSDPTMKTTNDRRRVHPHHDDHHRHHPYYDRSNDDDDDDDDAMEGTFSVSSPSTTDTFPPTPAIPTTQGPLPGHAVAAAAAVPHDYRVVQTFRRQSLWHRHNYHHYCWCGTKWLSDYLHDMNIDLQYIMSSSSSSSTQSLPNNNNNINSHDKEQQQHNDPVVQWETYMDQHHHPHYQGGTQKQKRPLFTVSLMIASTVLLLVSFHMNQWKMESFRDNSALGPSSDTLVRLGVLVVVAPTKVLFPAVQNDDTDTKDDAAAPPPVTTPTMEWYRILTTIGIHGGILHWLCSMMAILYVGVPMEQRYGTLWMGGTFVLTSIATNIGTLIYSPFDYILSPMGGICSWYGLRWSFIWTHYGTLCQLLYRNNALPPPPPTAAATALSGNSIFLSRTITKTPPPFPFRATQLALFLEMAFVFAIGLLPWINQFTNCCGLLYGLIIGLHVFQPSGSTYEYIQLYRQAAYLSVGTTASESKSAVMQKIRGIMYHLNLPIRRRIIPGILLCTIIGFSTTNIFYLYYSTVIGDLPCRSCHYVDCVPWPDTIYQHCEPCNYIKIKYVTVEESTSGDADADPNNPGINSIVISSNGDIENELQADETVPSGFHLGTNYFIEMICPYGESTFFVIPNQLPQNRKEWLQSCHDYCEL